jgi:hypothetical protein
MSIIKSGYFIIKKLFFDLCLVHVIFDVLKLSSNLESLFSFKFSAEQKSDLKEYKSLLLSFEALSLLS